MSDRKWYPFPIHILKHGEEEVILPTKRDIQALEDQRHNLEDRISDERDEGQKATLKEVLKNHNLQTERLLKGLDKLKEKAELRAYEVSVPDFGEFLQAEEIARHWVNGEPKVDEAILALQLVKGHVRIQGVVLDTEAVKKLDYPLAKKL
jgi:hypothetical protein